MIYLGHAQMKNFWDKTLGILKEDVATVNKDFPLIFAKCAVLGLFLFISIFVPFFVWITLAFACIFIVCERTGRSLYYVIFLFLLTAIFTLSHESVSFIGIILVVCSLSLITRYGLDLINKRKKIDVLVTTIVGILILYIFLPIGDSSIMSSITLGAGVAIAHFVFIYRKDINLKEITFVLILGLIFSTSIGMLHPIAERMSTLVPGLHYFQGELWRFSGATSNPNTLASQIVVAVALLLTLLVTKSIRILFYPMYIFLMTIMVFTVSQTGFIAFGFATLLGVIFVIIKQRKIGLIKTVAIGVCAIIVFFICYSYTSVMMDRFSSALINSPPPITNGNGDNGGSTGDGGNNNNSGNVGSGDSGVEIDWIGLTTGRVVLWEQYIRAVLSSADKFLFGFGTNSEDIGVWGTRYFDPHNAVLATMFYLGLVGLLLIIAWILAVIYRGGYKNIKWYGIIPALAVGLNLMAESLWGVNLFVYVTLCILALFYSNEKEQEEMEKNQEELPSYDVVLYKKLLSTVAGGKGEQSQTVADTNEEGRETE